MWDSGTTRFYNAKCSATCNSCLSVQTKQMADEAAIISGGSRMRPRWFWVSELFKQHHSYEYRVLQILSKMEGSVWRECNSTGHFAEQVALNFRGPARQHRPLQAVGLVTNEEKSATCSDAAYMFSASGLLDKFQSVDFSESAIGACGH